MESAKCIVKLKHDELYSIEIAIKANGCSVIISISSMKCKYSAFMRGYHHKILVYHLKTLEPYVQLAPPHNPNPHFLLFPSLDSCIALI